jgi:hypothetical protein
LDRRYKFFALERHLCSDTGRWRWLDVLQHQANTGQSLTAEVGLLRPFSAAIGGHKAQEG